MVVANGLGAALAMLLAADGPATAPAPVPQAAVTTVAPTAPTAPAGPSGQLRGTVSYGRHQPAIGAVVVMRPEGAASPVRAATTGTNGVFAFDGLPDGTYRVDVRRDGYAPVVKSGIRVKAPFRAVEEVLLARGAVPPEVVKIAEGAAALAGTIRTGGGGPVAEAHVRLTRVDGAADSRNTVADGAGAFSVRDLAAGRWRLDVQGAGLIPLRADLELAGEVAIEAQLSAQPAEYRPLPQDLLVPEDVLPPAGP
jgi:Carboxypeptidase regulatory-like domain